MQNEQCGYQNTITDSLNFRNPNTEQWCESFVRHKRNYSFQTQIPEVNNYAHSHQLFYQLKLYPLTSQVLKTQSFLVIIKET